MNDFVDRSLVGLVLLAGFGYAIYALGPKTLRARMVSAISHTLAALPAFIGLRGVAARLALRADKARAACGGCENCGSAPAQAQSSEVKIPVSAITRRE